VVDRRPAAASTRAPTHRRPADARLDGRGAGEVACGTVQDPLACPLPDQACCDVATGADHCFASPADTCVGGEAFHCDGPEDCAGAARCCYKQGSGASCTAGPDCAPGGSGGQVMCHVGDNAPCAPNGICCELGAGGPSTGSPFGACRTGACPL
jgi:hypothetical protein